MWRHDLVTWLGTSSLPHHQVRDKKSSSSSLPHRIGLASSSPFVPCLWDGCSWFSLKQLNLDNGPHWSCGGDGSSINNNNNNNNNNRQDNRWPSKQSALEQLLGQYQKYENPGAWTRKLLHTLKQIQGKSAIPPRMAPPSGVDASQGPNKRSRSHSLKRRRVGSDSEYLDGSNANSREMEPKSYPSFPIIIIFPIWMS